MTTSEQETSVWTGAPYSEFHGVSIPKAVAAQAARRPDATAVAAGTEVLTYHDLDCRANRLARYLRSVGVGADVAVGLCLPRSLDLVVGALGIMKAGGAYVPMDPAYPPDRLAFMLDDAQAPVLVTTPALAQRLPSGNRQVVYLDAPETAAEPDHLPRIDILPGDLAYVIYTSGSTGKPKGVDITHAGLANLVSWHRQAFSVTAEDRASHVAGLGFDAAVWELWPYLASGASVHLADDVVRTSPELLRDWLVAQGITIGFVPTPLAERMLMLEWPAKPALRIMLTGGDMLHHYPPANLPFLLVNNYGPTECTVVATSGPVLPDARPDVLPPIGRAITNTRLRLLDETLNEVPQGTPGELHIGGPSLARGYHNRPDLTAEKFIPDPFGEPGGRLYKTGDLARMLPDGQIAFMGRIDDQIKIRGYRIEPKEIVSVLNRHADVRDSLVAAREDAPGEKRLIAYVMLNPNSASTHTALCDFLREHLPEYMIPAAFVRVDAFPMTPNGKIDHAALPEPERANTVADDVSASPATDTQRRIAEIVAGLLDRNDIGLEDNFFMLGGHSLLGAQLIARLRNTFGVEIGLRSLFTAPTVAALSVEIERLASKKEALKTPERAPVCGAPQPCTEANPS
jgi:amino acid adenylation domain-containing protein